MPAALATGRTSTGWRAARARSNSRRSNSPTSRALDPTRATIRTSRRAHAHRQVQHEGRWLELPLATGIGCRMGDRRGDGRCEDGLRIAFLFFERRPAGAQRAARRAPFALRQQRVVARSGREHSFGRAEHDDQVEVGAHRVDEAAHEHALAEPPEPARRTIELVGEQADEGLDVWFGDRDRRARRTGVAVRSPRRERAGRPRTTSRTRPRCPDDARAASRPTG